MKQDEQTPPKSKNEKNETLAKALRDNLLRRKAAGTASSDKE